MTNTNRKTRVLVLCALMAVVAAAGLAYGFRDRLLDLPVVRTLFAAAGANTTPTMGENPAAPPMTDPEAVDPRAPVNLDLRRQQLIGVRTAPVERANMDKTIRTVGSVRYDETRLADVNLKIEGWIRDLHVDYTGKSVSKGDPLFTLYSPELLTTQQEYVLALRSRDQLRESQIPDVRERAERLVESARMRIALWDLPADQMRALDET
ncbi:MAG: efflux RND transporter periplasmic adaptor subunit, partial [Acidobacteria bacterium]|nr:efflux RND transporter periplasmic adaptor subunit [Acidobacteriota bacterium]